MLRVYLTFNNLFLIIVSTNFSPGFVPPANVSSLGQFWALPFCRFQFHQTTIEKNCSKKLDRFRNIFTVKKVKLFERVFIQVVSRN